MRCTPTMQADNLVFNICAGTQSGTTVATLHPAAQSAEIGGGLGAAREGSLLHLATAPRRRRSSSRPQQT